MAIPDAAITRHHLTKENSIFVHLSDLSAVEHVVADKDNFVKSEIIRAPIMIIPAMLVRKVLVMLYNYLGGFLKIRLFNYIYASSKGQLVFTVLTFYETILTPTSMKTLK